MSKILAVIPARGGSKGLPGKNIKDLNGYPLISYTINAAKACSLISKTVVSTDDAKIAMVSKNYNCPVIKRPNELARDDSSTILAILHALDTLKQETSEIYDIVVLLQPTSPLRNEIDIQKAISLFLENQSTSESLISVSPVQHPPFWMYTLKNHYLTPLYDRESLNKRRQDFPTVYQPNGAIYITTVENLKRYQSFDTDTTLAYIMPAERSIDIDTELDFSICKVLLSTNK